MFLRTANHRPVRDVSWGRRGFGDTHGFRLQHDKGPTASLRLISAETHIPKGKGRLLSDGELFALASKAKEKAVVPLSGFRVGAAAITEDGRVLTGHNLEVSDRSGSGTCAECNIAFQLHEGRLHTLLITSDSKDALAPCGACRQTLKEVAPKDARIIMTSADGRMESTTVGELLPSEATALDASQLAPYRKALDAARDAFERADRYGNLAPHGAVVVNEDGAIFKGATRKRNGTLTRAMQMAIDSRFMSEGPESAPKLVVFAGTADAPFSHPVPSGRDRQELLHLGPSVEVLLYDPNTGACARTTPEQLLPWAYRR